MQKLKFTKTNIEAIPHTKSGQTHYGDVLLTGFGLRVGRNVKSYFVFGRVNGRKRQFNIGRVELVSVEKARNKALALLAQMAEGVDTQLEAKEEAKRNITVSDAFEAFFEMRPNLSRHTVDGYQRTVRRYLPDWQKKPLCELTREMVITRHREISKQYGAVTANNTMRHLRSIYNCTSARFDEFPANPVDILSKTRSWHRETRRRTLIAAHDLPRWWKAVQAEGSTSRDFLTLALFTGMRRGELMKLRWENIDFAQASLHIPQTKNGDPLDLPLSGFLMDLLTSRKNCVGQSPWVFPGPGETGHLVETKRFTQRVHTKSGVKFTIHDLRRTFITIAESLDIPHYALKRLLNHRTSDDVTGGYIVINVERLRGPVEHVAAKILEMVSDDTEGENPTA